MNGLPKGCLPWWATDLSKYPDWMLDLFRPEEITPRMRRKLNYFERCAQGERMKDIARAEGISPGSVRALIHQAGYSIRQARRRHGLWSPQYYWEKPGYKWPYER